MDDFLYKSERWQTNGRTPCLQYEIPVPNGEYDVRLLCAENYVNEANKRIFAVKMEGAVAFPSIDIFKDVGKHRKLDKEKRTKESDGKLSIEFIDKVGNPKIGAIEVIRVTEINTARESVHSDIRHVAKVIGDEPMGLSWADSYSVGDRCYCDGVTTYDHDIEKFVVNTPVGWKTVREICELLGPGPGRKNRPIYKDVQCGNGPPNVAGDEHTCPGRVDIGRAGCGQIGPKWNFDDIPAERPKSPRFFLDARGPTDKPSLVTTKEKTWTWKDMSVAIKSNQDIPATVYQSHRSGKEVEYTIGDFEAAVPYKVSLGFAEIWEPNCQTGKRIMNIRINDNLHMNKLDVFEQARGCFTAFVLSYILPANVRGEFVVKIGASVENAMLSSIDIVPIR